MAHIQALMDEMMPDVYHLLYNPPSCPHPQKNEGQVKHEWPMTVEAGVPHTIPHLANV